MQDTIFSPNILKRTISDALDGYYAVNLDKENLSFTVLITEWDKYECFRMPEELTSTSDAYRRASTWSGPYPEQISYWSTVIGTKKMSKKK